MTEQELIFKLYFEDHLKQKEIAAIIKKSATHVSDVLKANPKTKEEKKLRTKQSNERKKQYNISYTSGYNMSDYDYAKWNPSAYKRNSKGNLTLIKGLKVGNDVPKSINMNITIPTQKLLPC